MNPDSNSHSEGGPLWIHCPVCGQRNVRAALLPAESRITATPAPPRGTSWLVCSHCRSKLLCRRGVDELTGLTADDLAQFITPEVSRATHQRVSSAVHFVPQGGEREEGGTVWIHCPLCGSRDTLATAFNLVHTVYLHILGIPVRVYRWRTSWVLCDNCERHLLCRRDAR